MGLCGLLILAVIGKLTDAVWFGWVVAVGWFMIVGGISIYQEETATARPKPPPTPPHTRPAYPRHVYRRRRVYGTYDEGRRDGYTDGYDLDLGDNGDDGGGDGGYGSRCR